MDGNNRRELGGREGGWKWSKWMMPLYKHPSLMKTVTFYILFIYHENMSDTDVYVYLYVCVWKEVSIHMLICFLLL